MTHTSRAMASSLGLLWALAAAASGCGGGDGSPNDDAATQSDGQLFPCNEPGRPCNPHNPCAIDPVCGNDGLCHPQGQQNCDDGLECTIDACLGAGKCDHEPDRRYCTLLDPKSGKLTCYLRGAINPNDICEICDSVASPTRWSGRNGGACDDDDPCSLGDQCIAGTCTGSRKSCSDGLQCTEDICDGKGGCSYGLSAGWCMIAGACYKDGERDASGCNRCDVARDLESWTAEDDVCKLGSRCLQAGELDATGCGVCDPALDPAGWTAAPDTCLIDGVCHQAGDPATTGCGMCDPKRSTAMFSPPPDTCLIDQACHSQGETSPSGCGVCQPAADASSWTAVGGASAALSADFEGGADGFSLDPASDGVGWQASSKRAHGGSASLYYGDPQSGSFDSPGMGNQGSALAPAVALPAGQHAALRFWVYLDVEPVAQNDRLTVEAGAQTLWVKGPDTVPPARHKQWVPVEVDLSSLAGQSVQLRFRFDSVDAWANTGEGVYIDDVVVLTGCGAL